MASRVASWGNDLYTGRRSYDIVGKRLRFYWLSGVLMLVSAILLVFPGLSLGIEFTGGSQFVLHNAADQGEQTAIDTVAEVIPGELARVTSLGESNLRVRTSDLDTEQQVQVSEALAAAYGITVDDIDVTFVSSSWGGQVTEKAMQGAAVFIVLVLVVMSLYFRNWRMALAAVIALFHDLLITVGVYALVGWEISPASVIGILTILGYSVYDTVVVFDKVRENTADIKDQRQFTYAEKANLAVNQTLVRSINTSVVAVLPVASILFVGTFMLGAGTLRDIALALFVGMLVGAYSSIFLATPLDVELRQRTSDIGEHTAKVLKARQERGDDVTTEDVAGRLSGQLVPGAHLGNQAQPTRKRAKRK